MFKIKQKRVGVCPGINSGRNTNLVPDHIRLQFDDSCLYLHALQEVQSWCPTAATSGKDANYRSVHIIYVLMMHT